MLLLLACAAPSPAQLAAGVSVDERGAIVLAEDGTPVRLHAGDTEPTATSCEAPCTARVENGWYWEARPEGLKFGIVVTTPGDTIHLPIQVEGATPRRIARDHVRLDTENATLHVTRLRALDADGKRLPARMDVEGDTLVLHVDSRGARFPVDVDPYVSPDAVGMTAGGELVALGDVDGDGYGDVATGDGSTLYEGEVHVFRGGAGGLDLAPAWTFTDTTGGDYGRALGGGDFDGDGYADLAILRYRPGPRMVVDVHPGSSAGPSPTATTTLVDGPDTTSYALGDLTVADIDGDGFDDLTLLDGDLRTLNVYLGSRGGLTASPAITLALPGSAYVQAAADVDGDGLVDLLAASSQENGSTRDEGVVWFYRNTGAGFDAAPTWTYAGEQYDNCGSALVVGDVDSDGLPELLVGCSGASESWASDLGEVKLFDGEALSATPSAVIQGTAAGDSYGADLDLGDLDGDGDADLLVGGWHNIGTAGVLALWWNDGGTFVEGDRLEGEQLIGVGKSSAVGDQDGDGIADVAAASGENESWGYQGTVWWWAGGPGGVTFDEDPPDWRLHVDTSGVSSAVTGDFDGGGRDTLVFSDAGDDRVWGILDPSSVGSFEVPTADYHDIVVTDLDADGYEDLVAASFTAIFVHRGATAGVETTASITLAADNEGWGTELGLGALGDVDGDGYPDLGYADPFRWLGDGTLNVVFGGPDFGTRTQVVPAELPDGGFGHDIAPAGDVNGDGYADVLVSSPGASVSASGSGRVGLYCGGPAGLDTTPAWTVDGATANGFLRMPSVGDVDGDGAPDVLVVEPGAGARLASLHLGDGVSFRATAAWTAGDAWTGRILADLDGDGDDEVAITTTDAANVRTLTIRAGTPVGPGGALHTFHEDIYGGACLDEPLTGDLDGDGVHDLVLTCFGARIEVWLGGPNAEDADGDGFVIGDDCDDTAAAAWVDCAVDTGGDTAPDTAVDTAPDTAIDTATDTSPADDTVDPDTSGAADDTGGDKPDESCTGCGTGNGGSWLGVLIVAAGIRRRRG